MNLSHPAVPPELVAPGEKTFQTLQAQLALHGIELLRDLSHGAEPVYRVSVRGQVSTFDSWQQLAVYVRGLGIPALG